MAEFIKLVWLNLSKFLPFGVHLIIHYVHLIIHYVNRGLGICIKLVALAGQTMLNYGPQNIQCGEIIIFCRNGSEGHDLRQVIICHKIFLESKWVRGAQFFAVNSGFASWSFSRL